MGKYKHWNIEITSEQFEQPKHWVHVRVLDILFLRRLSESVPN